jgi:hypothetical protein
MITNKDFFDDMKSKILDLDPVTWCEKWLNIDGKPFKITDNVWKPYVDMYRYIGINALSKKGKPIVFNKSRQVGGTSAALALSLFFLASGLFGGDSKPPFRIMHMFPTLEIAARYSKTKLNTTIATSKPLLVGSKRIPFLQTRLDKSNPTNDSITFKQFKGGSHLFIESTGLDASRLKGITIDCALWDECQLMTDDAISNSRKSLTAAQFGVKGDGVQFFFGTPLTKSGPFYNLWMASDQQYWHLGCEDCGKDFPLYTPGSDKWMEIWVDDDLDEDDPDHGYIVKCVHCGHQQNKIEASKRGKWVPYVKDKNCINIGFHLNQMMLDFPRSKIMSEHFNVHPTNTARAYYNEVLGEFYNGDSSTITQEELIQKCGKRDLLVRNRITPAENRQVFIGFDWGAKVDVDQSEGTKVASVGQSYSCAIVLVVNQNHLEVAWAEKFKQNDPEYKIQRVDQLARQFSPILMTGDIGFANDLSYKLQMKYGEKYLATQSLGTLNKKYKFRSDVFPNLIEFDKTRCLEEIFQQFKNGIIKFPLGSYEKISWLITHCTSMETKLVPDRRNGFTQRIVKGNTENDGLMAMLNAYLGFKFLQTNKFDIVSPHDYKEITKSEAPLITLAHLPHWK